MTHSFWRFGGRLLLSGLLGAVAALSACNSGTAIANPSPTPGVGITLVSTTAVPPNYGHHDTFVRDGLAFVCAWNTGLLIYDVGNGMRNGTPAAPVLVSSIVTSASGISAGPEVHNAWWFQNPVTGEKRYVFVGQEGPGAIGTSSQGDIHIVDVSDLAHPVEVGFIHVEGAGTHNFWMDEARQVLYAAYYNGGVIEVDVSGTLAGDMSSRITHQVLPGGAGNTYTWGVMLANGTLYATDMVSGFWALDPITLAVKGGGNNVPERYSSDQWISGSYAYSGTWGGFALKGGVRGNAIKIWHLDPSSGVPSLADSVIIANISTVSDLAVTADGKALVVTTEGGSGAGLYVYGLSNPAKPTLLGSVSVAQGLHTGEVRTMNGRTYVFAAQDPSPPQMNIYDITGVLP